MTAAEPRRDDGTVGGADWSVQQLMVFTSSVTRAADVEAARSVAVERVAEAFGGDLALMVGPRGVAAGAGDVEPDAVLAALEGRAPDGWFAVEDPRRGPCTVMTARVPAPEEGRLVVVRAGHRPFGPHEGVLLHSMAEALVHSLGTVRLLERERGLRRRSERQAAENAALAHALAARQHLFKATAHIQRLIARRAPLQQVLDEITAAAAQLITADVAALRLVDEQRPEETVLAAYNIEIRGTSLPRRTSVHDGVGGVAIELGRLVCFEDYAAHAEAIEAFADYGIRAAMAAPVFDGDTVIGSLTVGHLEEGRRYDDQERDALATFAEHAGLALADARMVEAMNAALHDSLTGLPNRRLLIERLDRLLGVGDHPVAVLFCDLDHFKRVNDSLGHAAGDALLLSVAARLRGQLRAPDTVARLGGDEFVVVLDRVGDLAQAVHTAQRLLQTLSSPYRVGSQDLFVSASIGVTVGVPGRDGSEEVLRRADLAMYQAKSSGRGVVRAYHSRLAEQARERLEIENALRRAVAEGELTVHYQPLVEVASGRPTGLEALVRWRHPEKGLVLPGQFIPIAESSDLIVELSEWVLGEACRAARRWELAHPGPALDMHVNVSPRHFVSARFVPTVREVLEASGLTPALLTLEITEGLLLVDAEATLERCREVRALGVRLALDDFGTGYSSLSYLRRLPVDTVKIDRSFVQQLDSDARQAALVGTIIEMAHTLGAVTVAEGVEEWTQLSRLAELACDSAQGFLLARPMPAEDIEAYLARTRGRPARQARLLGRPPGRATG